MAEYNYIGDGSPDGTIVVNTNELLGFYGTVPVVKYVGISQYPASTYITVRNSTATASTTGLNTDVAMSSMVAQVSGVVACLRNIGLLT